MGKYFTPLLLVSSLLVTACQQAAHFERRQAPANSQEVGQIVSLEAGKVGLADLQLSGLPFRVLNSQHGLYEIFTQDTGAISKIPSLKRIVQKNQYLPNVAQSPIYENPFLRRSIGFSNSELLSRLELQQSGGFGQIPAIFKNCDPSKFAKEPAQIIIGPELNPSHPVVNLGETVHFQGTPASSDEEYTYSWQVFGPQLSKVSTEVQISKELSIKLSNVGGYQFIHVARDSNDRCSMMQGAFLVTHNPQLTLPKTEARFPDTETLRVFPQLELANAIPSRDKYTGEGVVIAVLDSGLHFNHKAIQHNLALNHQELDGLENEDRDEDGFDHDFLGWDFINGDNNAFDDNGHGSHVSGIAASHVFGVAGKAKILPVKVLNAMGGGDIGSIAAGIMYAVDKGAHIINASLGSGGRGAELMSIAISYAEKKGVLVIAAAGNGDPKTLRGVNLDDPGVEVVPAELEFSNILSVASSNEEGALTLYSNFSTTAVDIAAPGGSRTMPSLSLATLNESGATIVPQVGTSMAAPIVAGMAAVALGINPDLGLRGIKNAIFQSGRISEPLRDKLVYEKVVDVLAMTEWLHREQPREDVPLPLVADQ